MVGGSNPPGSVVVIGITQRGITKKERHKIGDKGVKIDTFLEYVINHLHFNRMHFVGRGKHIPNTNSFHTASDTATSSISIIGVNIEKKSPDFNPSYWRGVSAPTAVLNLAINLSITEF